MVDAVLRDYRTAPISDADKALFAFVEKVNHHAPEMKLADVEEALSAGWPDEALYDAVAVCSLFNFYNRWNDAHGVGDMSAEDYARQAKRIAQLGYDID